MTTDQRPAFWLTRCPRCLAPFLRTVKVLAAAYGVSCARCSNLNNYQVRAEYDRRLAEGRVVARVPECYEVRKWNEYAKAKG